VSLQDHEGKRQQCQIAERHPEEPEESTVSQSGSALSLQPARDLGGLEVGGPTNQISCSERRLAAPLR
jgi:hypothetical protein